MSDLWYPLHTCMFVYLHRETKHTNMNIIFKKTLVYVYIPYKNIHMISLPLGSVNITLPWIKCHQVLPMTILTHHGNTHLCYAYHKQWCSNEPSNTSGSISKYTHRDTHTHTHKTHHVLTPTPFL